jgi:hypothetical protein
MKYRFSQVPTAVPRDHYLDAIERMISKLKCDGILSVSQVGGIGTPGISDIDLFVVFKDEFVYTENPVAGLGTPDNYLFTHNLFGTSEKFAERMEQYTYFGNYKNMSGKPFISPNRLEASDIGTVKKQIALEFLLKAWITIEIEKKYGVIKIRNLFLLAKALLYDLSFLNVSSGSLMDVIKEIIHTRNNWFRDKLGAEPLSSLVNRYSEELFQFLKKELPGKFFLPGMDSISIGRNILLVRDKELKISFSGFGFPAFLSVLHPKIRNLQSRVNHFVIKVPAINTAPKVITDRQHWIAAANEYNRTHLPAFVPTTYGLNIFKPAG